MNDFTTDFVLMLYTSNVNDDISSMLRYTQLVVLFNAYPHIPGMISVSTPFEPYKLMIATTKPLSVNEWYVCTLYNWFVYGTWMSSYVGATAELFEIVYTR